jgi:hypothetical protein
LGNKKPEGRCGGCLGGVIGANEDGVAIFKRNLDILKTPKISYVIAA